MNQIQILIQLGRHLGARWLLYRLLYAGQRHLGILERKTPARSWDDYQLHQFFLDSALLNPDTYADYRRSKAPPFFFDSSKRHLYQPIFQQWDKDLNSAVDIAEKLSRGIFPYFNHLEIDVGVPPDWHHNPLTDEKAPEDVHWSKLSDFSFGDIKAIWDASRFGFVYHLVRAYWRTGDYKYPELFWSLIGDWRAHNPPNQGVNWKCGQETTFRVMAWIFGLYGFADAPSTTPERITGLAQMIVASGERIAANLSYALSQRNNHGISEGMGLWTIGLLFPEFRQAEKWREKGRSVLEKLGRELIYDDGSFVQHSVNYHRLMLHDFLWAIRLGEIHNQPLSTQLQDRVTLAGRWLYQIQDEMSGQVPYYGQNDGALILPLNNCDYLDFRPVIQSVQFLEDKSLLYDPGPWDEDILWLFGPESLQSSRKELAREPWQAEVGGYYTLRSSEGFLFTRCATFHDRPGQADMLHVDIWWRGLNIAQDPGTFSYNAPHPWNNALAHTQFHNTITVDGRDQMERVGKFIWLPWLNGRVQVQTHSQYNLLNYWEGEHDGYLRLSDPVTHRRAILQFPQDSWLVIDALGADKDHEYQLHWLLADFPYHWLHQQKGLKFQTPAGGYHILVQSSDNAEITLQRAMADEPHGWRAPYYQSRVPALSLKTLIIASETYFFTLFTPISANWHIRQDNIFIDWGHQKAEIILSSSIDSSIIRSASLTTDTITDTIIF